MPRSKRPERYPTVCYRIASLMESYSDDFQLSFLKQVEAIDTRQMLFSFSYACEAAVERSRKQGDLRAAGRWHTVFVSMARWSLTLSPSYDKDQPHLKTLPATLHFKLRDSLPKHKQLDGQLDALETAFIPLPSPVSKMDDVYKALGVEVLTLNDLIDEDPK